MIKAQRFALLVLTLIGVAALVGKIDAFLGEGITYEEIIDRARIIGQEQKFLIAVGLLSGTLNARRPYQGFGNITGVGAGA